MIEVFLSSDGKHTVRGEVNDIEGYNKMKKLFDKIIEDYPGTKMQKDMDKAEKEGKLGNCEKCGAPMAWSSKSNKPYCSALCWTKNG